MGPPLEDENLPPLYQAANHTSSVAQSQLLWATRIRLAGLVAAAVFGLFTWTTNASPVDYAGVLGAISFGLTLIAQIYLLSERPQRTWYQARAAAESVKTLAWRYAVGGAPFGVGSRPSEGEVEDLFLGQLDEIIGLVKDIKLEVAGSTNGIQITKQMRTLRASSLEDRKNAYEEGRVANQQSWYIGKATWNRRREKLWAAGMIVVESAGFAAAILKSVGIVVADLLGLAGALVAAMMAWVQTRQHSYLATAYLITSVELASVRTKIRRQQAEADWAGFVADAEEAFSREHTLWKASRGVESI